MWSYLKFGAEVQEEMLFIRFLIWSSGGPPVQWSGTIYAILKEGILGNIIFLIFISILYQLTKFEAPSCNSFWNILITKFHFDPLKVA